MPGQPPIATSPEPAAAGAGHALAWILLAILAAGQIHLRVRQDVSLPHFNPDDDTGYFRNESAFQYRHALLVATGTGVPEIDRAAQYPEGVRTRQELTLAMEWATGWTWRIINLVTPLHDFRWFVLLFSAVMSSLCIPALYLITVRLSRSPPLASAATAVFALSWAGMANGVGTYALESFTLPLLLGSLACLIAALDQEERLWRLHAAAAGVLLAVALASWHFSRFHLTALFLALSWTAWRRRHIEQDIVRLRGCVAMLLAFAFAAGWLCAPLRHTAFILSPAMVLGYGLFLTLARLPRRALFAALAAILALALGSWHSGDLSAYGHVYGLLWAKLRHGLSLPSDPAQLSAEARLLWMGPFQSPDLGFLLFAFVPLAAIFLPRSASSLFGKRDQAPAPDDASRAAAPADLIDALLVIYLAGAILILRLTPFLAFLLCAAAVRLPRRWLRGIWLSGLVFLLAALEGAKTLLPTSPFNPFLRLSAAWTGTNSHTGVTYPNLLDLIRWLRIHGGPDRPVLANFGLSASLLTYAGSPIVLQPKFEAPGIRAKTLRFLQSLYSGEPEFLAFCRRNGAALFVYAAEDILDESPGGPRYASGDLRLRPDSAAVLFQFHPQRLKGFRLLHENPDFRVFAVSDQPAQAGPLPAQDPVYDLSRFSPVTGADGSLHLDVAAVNGRIAAGRRYLFVARIMAQAGRGEDALSFYDAAAAAWPLDEDSRQESGRVRAALAAARR